MAQKVIPEELQLQELDQAVHRHVEDIFADIVRLGLIHTEESAFALAKG